VQAVRDYGQMSKPNITIREATRADVPHLVALNRAAYPVLAKEDGCGGSGI